MIQQIMSRIIYRQRQTAALQLLRQRGVLSLLEIPVDTAINDEWLVAIGAQACSMEDLSIANCSDATSEGVLKLQKLTRLSRLHMYQLPVLGGVAAHFIGSMPYLKDLHLEGPQGGIELNEALCTSLGSLSGLEQLALVGATGLSAHHCAQVAEKLPQLQHVDLSNSDVEVLFIRGLCMTM